MTRHEIQVLRQAGVSGNRVATLTEVSERSVWRIAKEGAAGGAGPVDGAKRPVGRPSTVMPWTAVITGWLADERRLPSIEIRRRLQEQGYSGGKSAVYELVRRLRPPVILPLVRFEGVPGEFSQHDFGQVDVRYGSGRSERVCFFASRLKWSRVGHVVLVPDEREEALVRGLLAAFEVFGGLCYEDRAYVYQATIHHLEVHGKLEPLRALLNLANQSASSPASVTFPTRIYRAQARQVLEENTIQWLVEHNVLSTPAADAYGLVDEFLRIRLMLDQLEMAMPMEEVERQLILRASTSPFWESLPQAEGLEDDEDVDPEER